MTITSTPVGNQPPSTVNGPSRDKCLPTNKPLPNPPVASVVEADVQSSSRSLLDASDKPLRRTPPGKPSGEEDWPAIFPEKLSTPTGTPRFPFHGESSTESQHVTGLKERYPKLSSTAFDELYTATPATVGIRRKPLHNDASASVHSFRRKPVSKSSSPESNMASEDHKVSAIAGSPDAAGVKKPRNFSHPKQTRTSSLRARLSLGGASSEGITPSKVHNAVNYTASKEKSELTHHGPSGVSKKPTHGMLHQAPAVPSGGNTASRTDYAVTSDISSRDSGSSQLGHTDAPSFHRELDSTASTSNHPDDSTTGKETPKSMELVPMEGSNVSGPDSGLGGVPNNIPATTSKSNSGLTQLTATMGSTNGNPHQASDHSSDKDRTGRPPARTVAGVRRGSRARSSRLSGRYNIRLPNTTRNRDHSLVKGPVRTGMFAPHSETPAAKAMTSKISNVQEAVPRYQNIMTGTGAGHGTEISSAAKEPSSVQNLDPATESGSPDFDVALIHTLMPETNGDSTHHREGRDVHATRQSFNGPLEDVLAEYIEDSAPTYTDEIDHPGYIVKRLSKVSPEHGPTLLIASNANEVIMGSPNSDKENKEVVANETKSKDSRRIVLTNEVRKAFRGTKIPTAIKHSRLPRSASGDLLSRTLRVSTNVRDKKARSVDADLLLSRADNDPFTDGHKPVPTGAKHSQGLQAKTPLNRGRAKSPAIPEMGSDGPADFRSPSTAAQSNCSTLASYTTAAQEVFPAVTTTSQDPYVVRYGNQNPINMTSQNLAPGNYKPTESRTPSHRAASFKSASTGNEGRNPSEGIDDTVLLMPPNPPFLSEPQEVSYWPPRSSSKTPGSEYTTPPYISTQATQGRSIDPRPARDSRLEQETLETPKDMTSIQPEPEAEISKRTSQASKQSSHSSISKNVLSMSNLRGLFRRGHNSKGEEKTPVPTSKTSRNYTISAAGSPFTSRAESSTTRTRSRERSTPVTSIPSPHHQQVPGSTNSPVISSPASSQVAETTSLAMDILESARNETNSHRRERLLEMGKIMVDVITQARDAEKAMEEAKVAADKAQMAYMMTKKAVFDVAKMIEGWKREVDTE